MSFDIDANGILNVSAKDMATNKEQAITITAGSGLTENDIQRMVKESESHLDEDQKRRETIEAKNRLNSMIYNIPEKTMQEHKDKLSPDEIKQLEESLAEGKTALGSEDKAKMEDALNKITQASHRMAETLYKARSQGRKARTATRFSQSGPTPPPAGRSRAEP